MSKSGSLKPAIVVKGLTKTFKIPLDKTRSVKSRILGRAGRGYREFTPLNDISFTVYEGDFFGIVGRNGSGKSTLLKTIAGVYEPTAGKVEVNGTLVPFIELGVGFNPQLTGRENVYLNAALLGFSRSEIDDMYDDIVDFAELHDFMEERLQNYSSGMQVRLAFSIAIRAKGDILLLDEVLAVGDAAFQQKCYDYFEQLKKDKKTVILVTHSMSNVEKFCNRALLLDKGKISYIGSADEVAEEYRNLFINEKAAGGRLIPKKKLSDRIKLTDVKISQDSKRTDNIAAFKPFSIAATLKSETSLKNPNLTLALRNDKGMLILSTDYYSLTGKYLDLEPGVEKTIVFTIDNIYTNGDYQIDILSGVSDESGSRNNILKMESVALFRIGGVKNHPSSLTHPKIDAEIK